MFEKNVLRKILVLTTEEMTGTCKNLRKDDRNILIILQPNLSHHMKENEKVGHAEGVSEIS